MVDSSAPVKTVAEKLGHSFGDLGLLITALTHRSFVHEHPDSGSTDNERFEFLGDSIFGAAAAMELVARFPSAREGELTRRRADLVNERALAAIAVELEVGNALRLGRGEERSGGRAKPRLLASALEACIAAIFLDAGMERAIDVARSLLAPRVDAVAPGEKDYKSRLQEQMQARGETPRYEVERAEGPEHERVFHVAVMSRDGRVLARGSGRNKLEAEQIAARTALSTLDEAQEADA